MVNQEEVKDKLDEIVKAIREDDADDELSMWEINFIANQETKQKENDVEFSTNEATTIEGIYEKLHQAGGL